MTYYSDLGMYRTSKDTGQIFTEYQPPNGKDRTVDVVSYDTKRERKEKFQKAWEYFQGEHKKHLQVKSGEPDDNITLNLVRMTLERTTAFLYPNVPELIYLDENPEIGEEELWIQEVINANGGLGLFHKLALLGSLSGHVYVRIMQPNPSIGFKYPRIVPLSPNNIYTYYHSGDVSSVLWHELRWQAGDREYLIDFVNRYTHWDIMQYERAGTASWELNPTKSGKWDSPHSPIVHWQHLPNPLSFYGFSEVEDLTLQDSLNLVLSEASRILRYHASPRTIIKGIEADDVLETGIDNMWVIENPDASVQNLEMISQLEASNKIASLFYDTYLSMQRVTLLRGEVKDFQRVTNTGVRTVFMDSLAKRGVLINQYGRGISEVLHRVGLVGGYGDNFNVAVRHIDPLPMDELERAKVDELKLKTGTLSRQAIIQRESRSWDLHIRQLDEEYNNPIFHPLVAPVIEDKEYEVKITDEDTENFDIVN